VACSRDININIRCLVTSESAAPTLTGRSIHGVASTVARDDSQGHSQRSAPPAAAWFQPLTALIVVPTLQAGAADIGAVALVRILAAAGHRPVVVSGGGRLADAATAAGGSCVILNMASQNPIRILRNALALMRLVRVRKCDLIHAHGRAPAWSAYIAARMTGVPFLTTWYKGFREQNALKRLYNGVMARGDRVIAVSEQLAELINDRYGTPWGRIAVVPLTIDVARFDPSAVSRDRVAAVRRDWGVAAGDRVILVVGRMLRRKGHHLVAQAAQRLKAMGLKDFVVVFATEDHGTRYAAELWDQVLATETTDVIRMAGSIADLPAAYAAAAVMVSAAVQPEGMQRALLEAQAMARPVIVSDLGAGSDVVLAPPAVGNDRITGMRFASGDDGALAAALIRLFSMSEAEQRAIGVRGRAWVLSHFDGDTSAELTLKLYADVTIPQKVA